MKTNEISIVMGSDSDLPIIQETIKTLEEFDISYEVSILSAHRSPEEAAHFAKKALSRGIKVIVAAAGGAAHLAGVIASHFPLPVIGVPIKTSTLNGVDSLYSIVQMPPGVPVATVGINAAKNAGLLAIEILAVENKKLQEKLGEYKRKQNETVITKSIKLQKLGYKKYLQLLNNK